MQTIVFVCEHGSAKSVVAAAYFNWLAEERGINARAISRGTSPDAALHPAAVDGLSHDGLTPPPATPCEVSPDELASAARIVTFCHLPPEWAAMVSVEAWSAPPISVDYVASRAVIVESVKDLLERLSVGPSAR